VAQGSVPSRASQAVPDHTDGERLRHALYESGHVTRVFVRERNRILVVPAGDIERLEARGDYVALHVGAKRHLVQVTIADMERMLDPGRFVRVHRSHIVNLDYVVAFNTDPKGSLEVSLSWRSTSRAPGYCWTDASADSIAPLR